MASPAASPAGRRSEEIAPASAAPRATIPCARTGGGDLAGEIQDTLKADSPKPEALLFTQVTLPTPPRSSCPPRRGAQCQNQRGRSPPSAPRGSRLSTASPASWAPGPTSLGRLLPLGPPPRRGSAPSFVQPSFSQLWRMPSCRQHLLGSAKALVPGPHPPRWALVEPCCQIHRACSPYRAIHPCPEPPSSDRVTH